MKNLLVTVFCNRPVLTVASVAVVAPIAVEIIDTVAETKSVNRTHQTRGDLVITAATAAVVATSTLVVYGAVGRFRR